MTKSFWAWFVLIVAYSMPIITGLTMTGNWNVLWGYIPLLFSLLVFYIVRYDNRDPIAEYKKEMNASASALVFGVIIVIILNVFTNPYVLWLTVVQCFIAWLVYAMKVE